MLVHAACAHHDQPLLPLLFFRRPITSESAPTPYRRQRRAHETALAHNPDWPRHCAKYPARFCRKQYETPASYQWRHNRRLELATGRCKTKYCGRHKALDKGYVAAFQRARHAMGDFVAQREILKITASGVKRHQVSLLQPRPCAAMASAMASLGARNIR